MATVKSYRLQIRIGNAYKMSKAYPSVKELFAASADYIEQMGMRWTNVMIICDTQVFTEDDGQA